jgi:4-amino-4-deoxy-L-arabinose transferase-like glycosyltransferase
MDTKAIAHPLKAAEKSGYWAKGLLSMVRAPLFWIMLISAAGRYVYYSVLLNTIAVDTDSYVNFHANLLFGQTDGRRTPVYPYFIKLIGLFGADNLFDHVVTAQIIVSFLSIILFYGVVKTLFRHPAIIFIASLIYGLMLPVINFDKVLITESLSVTCCLLFIYLIVRYLKKPAHTMAWLLTLLVFVAVILRPSFIYLLPLVIVFWLLRLLTVKSERRKCLSGLAASVVVMLLMAGYSALNKINSGFNGISLVSNNNQMAVVVNGGLYVNGNDSEIIAAINYNKNLQQKNGGIPVAGINIMKRFDPERVHRYIVSCIVSCPFAYLQYMGAKLSALRCDNIFTNYADHQVNPTAFRVERFEYGVFRIPFMWLYIFIVLDLVLITARWIKSKQPPWINLVLWMTIAGQLAVAIAGGYSEYQRLILAAIPALVISVFFYVDMVCLAINKYKLKADFN